MERNPPELSIIIVSYNTADLLDRCLATIFAQTRGISSFEVIVVDNGSTDGSPAMVRAKHPAVRLLVNEENVGFGRANNQAVAASDARVVMLLNSDTILRADTATTLVGFLDRHPAAGVIGPDVRLLDGSRQPKTFGNLPTVRALLAQNLLLSRLFPKSRMFSGFFIETSWAPVMEVGWISGVCMVMPRAVYTAVGGFDPAFFMYAEDMDLCRRLHAAGWKVYRVEDHAVDHLCGGSSQTDLQILRNGVLQQRNFLKLLDATAGRTGRVFVRAVLAAGLVLRLALRSLALLGKDPSARLAFESSRLCLRDLVSTRPLPGTH